MRHISILRLISSVVNSIRSRSCTSAAAAANGHLRLDLVRDGNELRLDARDEAVEEAPVGVGAGGEMVLAVVSGFRSMCVGHQEELASLCVIRLQRLGEVCRDDAAGQKLGGEGEVEARDVGEKSPRRGLFRLVVALRNGDLVCEGKGLDGSTRNSGTVMSVSIIHQL